MTGDFSNGPFKLSEPLTTEVTGSYPPSSFPSWQLQNQDSVGHLCCRHAHTFIEIPTRHRYSLLSTSHTYLHIGALSHTHTHPRPHACGSAQGDVDTVLGHSSGSCPCGSIVPRGTFQTGFCLGGQDQEPPVWLFWELPSFPALLDPIWKV